VTARLTWKEDKANDVKPRRGRSQRRGLRALEWVFLLIGLLALDYFVWVNTSSVLYQAYEDWAFDQTLRGLTPGLGGFIKDEAHWLGGRQKADTAEAPPSAPVPNETLTPPVVPAPRSVIGRLEIPRLEPCRDGAGRRRRRHVEPSGGTYPGYGYARGDRQRWIGRASRYFLSCAAEHSRGRYHRAETTSGTYRYVVKSTRIVTPRDVSVLEASGGETLTLVTCYPFYYVGSAPKRFIVHAALLKEAPGVAAATLQRRPAPGS
jgi:sortase A